jgi:hypothetical protein
MDAGRVGKAGGKVRTESVALTGLIWSAAA